MSSAISQDELFTEFDSFFEIKTNLPKPAAKHVVNYTTTKTDIITKGSDVISHLKPVVHYKIVKAGLIANSYYKDTDKRYLKRCETTVQALKDELKGLHASASISRKRYIASLSARLRETKSILSTAYQTIIPEATGLIVFTKLEDTISPEFELDVVEYDNLLTSMHAYNHVLRVISNFFGSPHHYTPTISIFKKRLGKIRLLKYFLIGNKGLNETSYMQFISYLLLETYLWYLHIDHLKSVLGLKLDPLSLFKFMFKKSMLKNSFFLQKNIPLVFPHLKNHINETVCGFEIVGDDFEEAQIEFLDYN